MRFVTRRPRGALAPFVASIWLFEGPDLPHARERVLPNGSLQLLVNLHEDELRRWEGDGFTRAGRNRGAAIAGPYRGPVVIDTDEQRRITGVAFRPGGARPFFDPPVHELAAHQPDLDALWPRHTLRAQLLEAPSDEALLDVWERFLRERLGHARPDRALDHAVALLDRGATVREVSRALEWSDRRLRRRFARAVGLTPKRFARIRRLQRVLRSLAAEPASWAQLAADCGFCDQAHLIHDFRELAGTTPTRYRARDDEDPNHVVVD
ncbi:MAG TPA: AraC family transcriptional regulator [Sandaracinaceae bacterium LLY-WYZ-13_1]|nr:AraC family transcriptional regulator [Sandaracinaceae bacterium LLY-WYZ-13_1]